eukprot:2115577-Rhodomonas_salina.2
MYGFFDRVRKCRSPSTLSSMRIAQRVQGPGFRVQGSEVCGRVFASAHHVHALGAGVCRAKCKGFI